MEEPQRLLRELAGEAKERSQRPGALSRASPAREGLEAREKLIPMTEDKNEEVGV